MIDATLLTFLPKLLPVVASETASAAVPTTVPPTTLGATVLKIVFKLLFFKNLILFTTPEPIPFTNGVPKDKASNIKLFNYITLKNKLY